MCLCNLLLIHLVRISKVLNSGFNCNCGFSNSQCLVLREIAQECSSSCGCELFFRTSRITIKNDSFSNCDLLLDKLFHRHF